MTPTEQCITNRLNYILKGYRIVSDIEYRNISPSVVTYLKAISRSQVLKRANQIGSEFGVKVVNYGMIDTKLHLRFKAQL